jgi:hypothetical protein
MKDYETDEPAWIHEENSIQVTQRQKKWFTVFLLVSVPFSGQAGLNSAEPSMGTGGLGFTHLNGPSLAALPSTCGAD